MTRKQRQAAQPKFVPRQWPSDPHSIYLLARAERIGELMRASGRSQTEAQSERWTCRDDQPKRTRISCKLGK